MSTHPGTQSEWLEVHVSVLDFERTSWQLDGSRDEVLRRRFDLSATQYATLVSWVIDQPEAEQHDPVLVRRLQRRRQARRSSRRQA